MQDKTKAVTGFVAAGGRSSRMGKDKAWLQLAGRPMIEHVITSLRAATTTVALLANDPEYAKLGFKVFKDSQAGIGPLEAIRTALKNSSTDRVIMVGCDLPFVTTELFKFLLNVADDYDVVVPMSAEGKLEPLCAIYRTTALEAVEELIASGQRRISPLFDKVATRFVRFGELEALPGSHAFFTNINTPDDYDRAISRMDAGIVEPPQTSR
jgi:molybdopterin-guanine dinucleotide biosynthesis protein A